MVPSWAGGEIGAEYVRLDDEYRVSEIVVVGQSLVLSVLKPRAAGYTLAGASFDPTMLRLDSVLDDPDDPQTVLYGFIAVEDGTTIVSIRAQKEGSDPETYKVLELKIEQ